MRYEVTLDMIVKGWKGRKPSPRTARRILKAENVKWEAFKKKPVLTESDMAQREKFAKKWKARKAAWWDRCVAIDGKWCAPHRRPPPPARPGFLVCPGLFSVGGVVGAPCAFPPPRLSSRPRGFSCALVFSPPRVFCGAFSLVFSPPGVFCGGLSSTRVFPPPGASRPKNRFKLWLTKKHREDAARAQVRGSYRKNVIQTALKNYRIKKGDKMKSRWGGSAPAIGAICGPQYKVFTYLVPGGKWNARAAALFYRALADFLRAEYPESVGKKWVIIEDNDPAGFRAKKSIEIKKELKLEPIGLPPKSPDISPLDYSIWSHVLKTMRAQERKMRKKESKKCHIERIKSTMKNMDKNFLRKTMRSMKKRLTACYKAKGGHFEV